MLQQIFHKKFNIEIMLGSILFLIETKAYCLKSYDDDSYWAFLSLK